MTGKNILLTGITGNLGAYAARQMLQRGDNVYALARGRSQNVKTRCLRSMSVFGKFDDEMKNKTENNLHVIVADITKVQTIHDLPLKDIDETWHFASTLKFLPKDREEIYSVNIDALNNIIDAHKKYMSKSSKFFYISTAYVGGAGDAHVKEEEIVYSEDSPFHNDYERTKLEAENLVIKQMKNGEIEGAIFRPSIVVASKYNGKLVNYHGYYMGLEVIVKLKKHFLDHGDVPEKLRIRAVPNNSINLIPIDDAVELMLNISDKRFTSGSIFNIVNNEEVTIENIFEVVSKIVGMNLEACPPEQFDNGKKSKYEKVVSYGMTYTMPYANDRIKFDTYNVSSVLNRKYSANLYPEGLTNITRNYTDILM